MPSFIIKVAYNGVIRKIGITDGTFPSFTRLSDKIRSVFNISKDEVVTAQKVLYSPDGSGTILLAHKVSTDAEFKAALSTWGLYGKPLPPKGGMRMTILTDKPAPKSATPTSFQDVLAQVAPASEITKPAAVNKSLVQYDSSDSESDDEMPRLMALKTGNQTKQAPPMPVLYDDDEIPDLIPIAGKARQAAGPSSVSQTLHSTLQSSLKTLETLRRLSPPSSTIPLASASTSGSVPHVHSASCDHASKPATAAAVPSTAVTREDLASALASTKEDIKGILSSFLASYAGKMADTFGADAEDVRTPEATSRGSSPVGRAQQHQHHHQQSIGRAGEKKELEVWFDAEGTQIQVWCDGCGSKVGGLRFKCVDCTNYDLCSTCVPALCTSTLHSTQHRFKPIPHPLLAAHLDNTFRGTSDPVSTSRSSSVAPVVAAATSVASAVTRHPAYCDFCATNIEGDRFKCLDCPDWDCCTSCYGLTPEQHPAHSFVKIRDPSDFKRAVDGVRPTQHRGVVCDGCDKDIEGIRYKCVHPDCADYDLCESCEAAPIERHPRIHPMLKLRVPLHVDAQVWFDGDDSRVTRRNPTEAQLRDQLERATPSSFSYGTPAAPSPVATPVPSVAPVETPAAASLAPSVQAPSFVADLLQPVHLTVENISGGPPCQYFSTPEKGNGNVIARECRSTPCRVACPSEVGVICGPVEVVRPEAPYTRIFVQAEVAGQTEAPALRTGLHARFDADITVNDAASFPAGALFVKTWRLQNNGTTAFAPSTALRYSSGEKLQANVSQVTVGAVEPGETFEVSVEMKAPEMAGRYVSFWRLANDESAFTFGDRVWTDIIVVDPSVRGRSPGTSSISSSSIIMPAAPSVAPAASIPATDSPAGSSPSVSHDDSGSDVESVADGSEMSAFGTIESHEHEHEHEGFGSENDESDEEEFVVVQDEAM